MKAIAAMSENRVIGNNGGIPWHIPADFKWFKECTLDSTLIMGRKTVESLPGKLPRRSIITLSGNKTPDEIMDMVKLIENNQDVTNPKDVWLCGGAKIYELLLPYCTDLYLTRVHKQFIGDTFFPDFEDNFGRTGIFFESDEFTIEHWERIL